MCAPIPHSRTALFIPTPSRSPFTPSRSPFTLSIAFCLSSSLVPSPSSLFFCFSSPLPSRRLTNRSSKRLISHQSELNDPPSPAHRGSSSSSNLPSVSNSPRNLLLNQDDAQSIIVNYPSPIRIDLFRGQLASPSTSPPPSDDHHKFSHNHKNINNNRNADQFI